MTSSIVVVKNMLSTAVSQKMMRASKSAIKIVQGMTLPLKPPVFLPRGLVAAKVIGIGAVCVLVTTVLYCSSKKCQKKGKAKKTVDPSSTGDNGNYVHQPENPAESTAEPGLYSVYTAIMP